MMLVPGTQCKRHHQLKTLVTRQAHSQAVHTLGLTTTSHLVISCMSQYTCNCSGLRTCVSHGKDKHVNCGFPHGA